MERGGPRARENRRLRQAPSRSSGIGFLCIRGRNERARQARQALRNIVQALAKAGATPADVVRTRIYVTDISRWEEVGRAHQEVFGTVLPATTMVEVARLIDPVMLVEIEADAIVVER